MITREQLIEVWYSSNNAGLHDVIDSIMKLIVDERNQYQELVDASVEITKKVDYWQSQTSDRFVKAIKPYIKLSLSEKITKLSDMDIPTVVSLTLKELAEEAKTLEQDLELR